MSAVILVKPNSGEDSWVVEVTKKEQVKDGVVLVSLDNVLMPRDARLDRGLVLQVNEQDLVEDFMALSYVKRYYHLNDATRS